MLLSLAKGAKNVLRPFGHTDVLLFYSVVADKLRTFLKGKEIASKIWIPSPRLPFFLRRGSKFTPLYIDELADKVTKELLEFRARLNLRDAKNKITAMQEKIWSYFVPRRLADFFYATNREGPGKPIDRIFFDLDRGKGVTAEQAQQAARLLVKVIKADKQLKKLIKFKFYLQWTGSSFHLYLLMPKKMSTAFYDKYFKYSKDEPGASFTGRWAAKLDEQLNFKIIGGHEKQARALTIDPSQSPSGKLARAPFSLHMADASTVDGIALPVAEKQLGDKRLIKKLKAYTPEKVIKELNKFGKLLR